MAFAILLAGLAGGPVDARAPQTPDSRWQPRGTGVASEADWRASDGATRVRIRCDRGDARLVLRIDSDALPAGLQSVALVADGVDMAYPLQKADAAGETAYVARLALDAPILDRILAARAFTLLAGAHTVRTGVPGDALARVVRACRARYWPREAAARARQRSNASGARMAASPLRDPRMASSEAGLAKK